MMMRSTCPEYVAEAICTDRTLHQGLRRFLGAERCERAMHSSTYGSSLILPTDHDECQSAMMGIWISDRESNAE